MVLALGRIHNFSNPHQQILSNFEKTLFLIQIISFGNIFRYWERWKGCSFFAYGRFNFIYMKLIYQDFPGKILPWVFRVDWNECEELKPKWASKITPIKPSGNSANIDSKIWWSLLSSCRCCSDCRWWTNFRPSAFWLSWFERWRAFYIKI